MKLLLAFSCICLSLAFLPATQKEITLQGAWSGTTEVNGSRATQVLLFSDGYFSWTSYKTDSGEFIQTQGGRFSLAENDLSLTYEFSTADSMKVGTTESWKLASKGALLQLTNKAGAAFKGEALDRNIQTKLTGAWLMAGRKQDDKITRRDTTTPRKTMKILTGNRFQWIAYNTETKQFSGTGGGTYTATDSTYVEKIEFFSRDNKRVGAQLQFKFEVQGNDWHHSGKSSAGEPLYEIWAKRE